MCEGRYEDRIRFLSFHGAALDEHLARLAALRKPPFHGVRDGWRAPWVRVRVGARVRLRLRLGLGLGLGLELG